MSFLFAPKFRGQTISSGLGSNDLREINYAFQITTPDVLKTHIVVFETMGNANGLAFKNIKLLTQQEFNELEERGKMIGYGYNYIYYTMPEDLENVKNVISSVTKSNMIRGMEPISSLKEACAHVSHMVSKNYAERFPGIIQKIQGGSRKTRQNIKVTWIRTNRKVTIEDGNRRTLYKNSNSPGDLRVRKMVTRKGKKYATYVKP
jgi:hypothetical protein